MSDVQKIVAAAHAARCTMVILGGHEGGPIRIAVGSKRAQLLHELQQRGATCTPADDHMMVTFAPPPPPPEALEHAPIDEMYWG